MKRVTIQGIAGCYHDAAAHEFFGDEEIETIPCDTFPSMFDTLRGDPSLFATLAIENTIAGSLLQNHELLRKSNMTIIGEQKMHISHVLAALPGQSIESLTEVNSHPMALMQCENFLLHHPNMKMVEKNDTAGSACEIAEKQLMGHAAICGKYAAQLYGLEVLAEDIQTIKRNFTRFLILADPMAEQTLNPLHKKNKASLVFALPHEQGSLSQVLAIFSFYGMNLTKIQSLPILGREWEYRFYINLTFDDYTRYRQSVDAVRPLISDFKILGEYEEFKQQL
ncbi:MAG: prephenate dehydratase [Muribaculaceae bacterium]|nr:prephenate dehydratase [Bacteroidales bacterium]MDY5120150.1 prephenate dehydratase [Muribaculaceae bacterium]